jgi:hypothetical protein
MPTFKFRAAMVPEILAFEYANSEKLMRDKVPFLISYHIYVIHFKNVNNSEQLLRLLTFTFAIYARIPIYQAPTHPWKQSGMPEEAVFSFVKKALFVILSFSSVGLTQD